MVGYKVIAACQRICAQDHSRISQSSLAIRPRTFLLTWCELGRNATVPSFKDGVPSLIIREIAPAYALCLTRRRGSRRSSARIAFTTITTKFFERLLRMRLG